LKIAPLPLSVQLQVISKKETMNGWVCIGWTRTIFDEGGIQNGIITKPGNKTKRRQVDAEEGWKQEIRLADL